MARERRRLDRQRASVGRIDDFGVREIRVMVCEAQDDGPVRGTVNVSLPS